MKTIAIMQPYFFPYLGYFSLLECADEMILFDTAQFDRKGWMHRNRILKPGGKGVQYFRVGIEKPAYQATIQGVLLDNRDEWKNLIFRQLDHYKSVAPFYKETIYLVQQTMYMQAKTLTEINQNILVSICEYIGIQCSTKVWSRMNQCIGDVYHAGQWALRIAESLEADVYVNPIGGRDIFVHEEFQEAGIRLLLLENTLPVYNQHQERFEKGLSVIDAMMFNSRAELKKLVASFKLTEV